MSCRTYTVGHSTKSFDDFLELCSLVGIDLIADVRRFPVSRRHPQFTRERLDPALRSCNIAYAWLGDTLGGFREGGYEEWMVSEDFERGLAELERLAGEHSVGFMCAEGLPWKCHRRFVADALVSRGHEVAHVLPDSELVWVQPPLAPPGP